MIDLPDPVEEMTFPPDLSQYPAKAAALQQLTDNIRSQQQLKRGIRVSYPTTWRAYSKWHSSMYGIAPPVCAQTGLMWVTRIMATQFLIHGAQHGMTANQVHPPPPPSPLPTTQQDVGLCGAVERRCRALSDGVASPKLLPEARFAVRVPLPTACLTPLCLAMQVSFTVPDGDRRDDDVPEIQGQFLNTLNTNFRTRHRDLIRRQKRSNGDESKTMTLTCQSTL